MGRPHLDVWTVVSGMPNACATDAQAAGLPIVGTFPAESHSPIVYPAAATAGASEAGRAFLVYLATREGMAPFLAEGFTRPVPPTDG